MFLKFVPRLPSIFINTHFNRCNFRFCSDTFCSDRWTPGRGTSQFYFESKTGSLSCSSWWQHVRSALRVQFGRVVGARQEDPGICVRNGEKKSLTGSEMNPSPGGLLWVLILSHVLTKNWTEWGTDSRRDRAQPDTHSRLCAHHLYLAFLRTGHGTRRGQVERLKKKSSWEMSGGQFCGCGVSEAARGVWCSWWRLERFYACVWMRSNSASG